MCYYHGDYFDNDEYSLFGLLWLTFSGGSKHYNKGRCVTRILL